MSREGIYVELKGYKMSNMSREGIYVDIKGSKLSNMSIGKAQFSGIEGI